MGAEQVLILNNFNKNMSPLLIAGFIMLVMCISYDVKADNEIGIKQTSGNSFALNIEQIGYNNEIKMYNSGSYLSGANLSMHLFQANEGPYQNTIDLWHIDGSDNSIRWGQGGKLSNADDTTFTYDEWESGGHYARLDIHGDNNSVSGYQANFGAGAHTYNQLIFSDGNSVYVEQRGNGNKTLNLTINNDDNIVSVIQRQSAHNATISLSGSNPTTLNLLQQGGTAQTYSLTQNCISAGGCSVSVTQQ